MEIIYGWKLDGIIKVDAQKVGKELESLGGNLTASKVLDFAKKKKKSELHKHFEWDDAVAGEKYRLQQAREVIRFLTIVKPMSTSSGEVNVQIRAYESVPCEEASTPRIFVPVDTVLTVPSYKASLFEDISTGIRELQEKGERYSSLLKSPSAFKAGLA